MIEHILKCQNCGYNGTYSKENVRNVGTAANMIWQVPCSQCKQGINTGESPIGFPQNKDLILDYDTESGGIRISNNIPNPKSKEILPGRIKVEGFGSKNPLASNASVEGREKGPLGGS